LSDVHFPNAAKIVLVHDNLNTHKPASLYEAFPAPEARRLVERFEWHYTPKHGSWLDMAESELGVLASQCLNRRIADKKILAREVNAWQDHRNKHHAKAFLTTQVPSLSKTRIKPGNIDDVVLQEKGLAAMLRFALSAARDGYD
jgi:DDE superfamily endonuclease